MAGEQVAEFCQAPGFVEGCYSCFSSSLCSEYF
jgi:hypothetical protein